MMIFKRTGISLCLILIVAGAAVIAFGFKPQTGELRGHVVIIPKGTVTVNGTSAISGATVFSDSTVTTAKGSSAVVSLGKLGRVEVLPETTMKLSYTASSFTLMLETPGSNQPSTPRKAVAVNGSTVRWFSAPNAAVTAITNDGQVVTDSHKRNEVTIDTSCGNTFVSVQKGSVELRAGNTVKQIAAGGQDTAGQARPGCTPGTSR